MTMHLLPPMNRAIAFVFPAIIVVIAALTFPVFIKAGLGWWPVFILGLPGILAMVICMEFRATSIGFDANGVHYQAVGYKVYAPWMGVVLQPNRGKPVLLVTKGERQFFPWLGVMYKTLSVLMPYRARYASYLTATIPLHFFLSTGNDAVMRDLRASAPPGFA
jgi:hypothetical protein